METANQIIRSDLIGLKSKLEIFEKEFADRMKEVDLREERFKIIEQKVDEILQNRDGIITLNIGGKVFQTRASTLLSVKDTLFYGILCRDIETDSEFSKEMFFDRSYTHFPLFLDYLRTKRFSLKGYNKFDVEEVSREAEYYGFSEIINHIEDLKKEITIIGMDVANRYSTAGTHSYKELHDKSMTKGICVESPYHIILELNSEHEFDKIEIGGWNGNPSLWYPGNGANAQILTSVDKKSWKNVGTIPSNYGAFIQTVKLKKTSAKFIKFQHTGYVGLGYLKIHKM